ncbi:MAG TPA: hypothetical protein DCZ49_03290 [Hyphomonadaceae bacterium]|nr:hypothetical protein [Hyphomonadaceae bacterium]
MSGLSSLGGLPGLDGQLADAQRARIEARLSQSQTPTGLTAETAQAVAQDFEALTLGFLLNTVFEQLPTDGPFGGGAGERAFRPLLVEEYAKQIAASGGIGLADTIAAELLRVQSGSAGTAP